MNTNFTNSSRQKSGCSKKITISPLVIVISVFVISVITIILLVPNNSILVIINTISKDSVTEPSSQKISEPITELSEDSTTPEHSRLITRSDWNATPPVKPLNPLSLPVSYVIIHHTATRNCSSQQTCTFLVRLIQNLHIKNRQWLDIGYNFLVGGDGQYYEGRGWNAEGAHTYGYNTRSIGIAFLGNFETLNAPENQITACKRLIDRGVERGFIEKNYKLLAARQVRPSDSPGNALYEDIKTWNHWSENI